MLVRLIIPVILLVSAMPGDAGELVLPVFAHNVPGRHGDIWSSEIYLTNPGEQPVLVEFARFLPGQIGRPAPCDQFMSPTRVVPPQSATVWTSSGLATDLGCAETARGGLVLRADGPIHVTSRLVSFSPASSGSSSAVLSGRGESFEAIAVDALPAAGVHLLPALLWHRNPCNGPLFDTSIGFANPGSDPITVTLDVPEEHGRAVSLDGVDVYFPVQLEIAARSWQQVRLAPAREAGVGCGGVESFLLRVEISAPLALYASVIDRTSGDPRTVSPVWISDR
jgi:hypothetical protein